MSAPVTNRDSRTLLTPLIITNSPRVQRFGRSFATMHRGALDVTCFAAGVQPSASVAIWPRR